MIILFTGGDACGAGKKEQYRRKNVCGGKNQDRTFGLRMPRQ